MGGAEFRLDLRPADLPTMTAPTFDSPPATRNAAGEMRCVGFEFEFAGPPIEDVVELVRRRQGGTVTRKNPYCYEVSTEDLGAFTVELDWALLSDSGERRRVRELVGDSGEARELVDRVEELVAGLAASIVPLEVVTPPIPLDRLAEMEALRAGLCELGALGTGESLIYAFGMHLNPEAPSLEASSLLAHLRAFLLLQDWLSQRHDIDLTRRLTPYIKPFAKAFAERVLRDDYAPSLTSLIDDYLEHNPTRNRPLDMLPLFAHIEGDRTFEAVDDPRVTARPAYHYRLPGCRVDQPEWRLAREWNLWLEVERLAADPPRLETMRRAYLELAESPLGVLTSPPWKERVEEWL